MKSDSSRSTSRSPVRKLQSNGDYVLRQRLEMSSSWMASAFLRSTRREKCNRTESTLIWRIFRRNCSNKHAALATREVGHNERSCYVIRWPTSIEEAVA